ncbi:hypothetical protein INT47_012162 [Mucor saturninus]|uniref:Rho-GAP domain-containing protein n=1 Tax=Mucor saturninus TaxID=64648 RepID=A0A8H7QVJ7_9FUNG|nr:hypothetical protein INT47_012162 [Mucor saturninus]
MKPQTLSDSDSDASSMSLAFSDDNEEEHECRSMNNHGSSSSQQLFARFVRDTRFKVEQKTSEINATMQEKLPEWKLRGALYSTKAKETSIEWSRRGKVAVDRWKKDRAEEENAPYNPAYRQQHPSDSENAVFGMPLEVAVALTKIDTDDLIPAVFKRCIEYLNDVGVHEVGIYRIPGSTITVNKLRAVFNDGSDIDFHVTKPDPHAVGTLLKMYLRELPEPIIPFELANEYTKQFMQSIQSSNTLDKEAMQDTLHVSSSLTDTTTNVKLPPISPDLLKTVRSITSKLPIYSFCLLQLLSRHLKKVADNQQENRMSVSNLAVIFIPTLNIGRALFHCMVEHYGEIFEGHASHPHGGVTTIIPPPLPQKPRNLSIHANEPRKISHTKTMSDTQVMFKTPKVPPPKPSRSPLPSKHASTTTTTTSRDPKMTGQSQPIMFPSTIKRPHVPPIKPRSKSLSSPTHRPSVTTTDVTRKRSGRVEAIGKQFETLMSNNQNSFSK